MPAERRKVKIDGNFAPNLFTRAPWEDGSELKKGETFHRKDVAIHFDRAEQLYPEWPTPICIISDGPYGVSGFLGDEKKWASLADWYEPHIQAWSQMATPQTTLWFWNR